jgi:thiol-disulfide isomerase/thioredoxin
MLPALALLVACQRSEPAQEAAAALPASTSTPQEPAVEPVEHHGIAWFEDAPAAAQALAEREHKPLVVDLWAPWCHTCLSMKNFVLTREKLGPELAAGFVFLSLNTERAENASVLEKLPVEAWPTFYVADGRDLAARGRWVGAAAPAQFADFMRDGQRAYEAARAGTGHADDAFAWLLRGDALARAHSYPEAAQAYGEALLRGGNAWPRRADALVSQITALSKVPDPSACVDLALARMNDTGSSVSAADFAVYALSCADELEAKDPRVKKVRALAAARLTPACEATHFTLTPDDRSDACAMLREARAALGDRAGEQRAARTRLTILEQAGQGLPDEVALTYDWARAESLISLGRAEEALSFLEARERALPGDYNPPHYLARVYNALGRWELGLQAIERALGKAYGPRKASMLGLKADLLLGQGKQEEATQAVRAQLALYRTLPTGQRQERGEKRAEQRLATLTGTP